MQDLIKKIQDLRELMKGLLAKPGQNSLVPALKSPTVRPIAMPSGSSKPTEIPGVTPPSGKDPKKMAEQLKNPRPKKVKMEVLKTDKNGQWSLEKQDWKHKDVQTASEWADSGLREHLDKLPKASNDLRGKMLNDLSEQAQTRVNPDTNHKEFLLHRAVPAKTYKDSWHGKNRSSWTANPKFAEYWARTASAEGIEGEKVVPHQVLSAWIPHHKIHSYLPTVLGPKHEKSSEHEIIVEPHDIEPHKVKLIKPRK